MGIKVYTPDLSRLAESTAKDVEDAVVYNLSYIGERCVTEARTGHSYTDRTGNLTSSIGYVIVKNGQIVMESSFETQHGQHENMQHVQFKSKSGKDVDYWAKGASGDGRKGSDTGKQFARSLAAQRTSGISLIVVAGMNYARYVADKGFNVLDSAEILADRLVPGIMEQLGFRRNA